jgi:hypothetical protein
LLVATQATWFSVPALLSARLQGGGEYLAFATVWLSVAHSIQYLWVTSYYARRSNPSEHLPRYFVKTLLAGALITTLPALLLAPRALAAPPYDMGLALLVFSVVNIHHFVLDGAIWKLRDGRVARVLLRSAQSGEASPGGIGPERRPWAAALVWTAGAAALVVALVGIWSKAEYRQALAKQDLPRLESSVRRLAWIGRDNWLMHLNLGRQLVALRGDRSAGQAEVERSIALRPSAEGWTTLGWLHATDGEWEAAIGAYESALSLDPNHREALLYSSAALLYLGRPERAREALARAAALAPEDRRVRRALEELDRATGSRTPRADLPPGSPGGS